MRICLIVPLLLALPAHAAQVYKCKGTQGEFIYQNIPCAANTPQVATGNYAAVPDEDHPEYSDDPPLVSETPTGAGVSQVPRLPENNSIPRQTAAAGYQCRSPSKTWVQSTPCPSTVTRRVSDTSFVTGTIDGTGQTISGVASRSRSQTDAVEQTAMTKDQLCAHLKNAPRMGQGKSTAGDDSYERNKMRRANNCGN